MRWHRFFSSLPKLLQVGLLPNGLTRAAQYHNAHCPRRRFCLLGITEEYMQDEDDFTDHEIKIKCNIISQRLIGINEEFLKFQPL